MSDKMIYAENYADEMKWKIFPLHFIASNGQCSCGRSDCKSKGKHPLTANGFHSATVNINQIHDWWQNTPDANIGVATGRKSNLIVVDIDEAKGAKLSDLYKIVDKEKIDTLAAKTGGGRHLYFSYPIGTEIKNSASRLAYAIDIRGDGGYVVAPPSNHVSGNSYEWLDYEKILPFPDELIKFLNSQQTQILNGNGNGLIVPAPRELLKVPEIISEGSRNETLTRIAGSLRNIGLNQVEMEAAISQLNHRICNPPLDAREVMEITRSVSRYETENLRETVEDEETDAERDYLRLNTLKPFAFSSFREQKFEKKEILAFHIGKRDIAMVAGATNAGKSTFIRNGVLCLAAGRPFDPFIPERAKPVKTLLIDFESDAEDLKPDLVQMFDVFTPDEKRRIDENLIVLPKGLVNGELFQLNKHWEYVTKLITFNNIELIVVDNISSAFDLNDENSNAEVTKKVVKPLLKLAYSTDCATVFVHHFGKKANDGDIYAGRGASALQGLSKTVINLYGDVSAGDTATIACEKRKADGGTKYREVFKLNSETRWFEQTMTAPAPKKQDPHLLINSFISDFQYPQTITTKEIIGRFQSEMSVIYIKKILADLVQMGMISKPKYGHFCRLIESDD